MRIAITKHFDFEASHFLPRVPAGHKCGRMHGHSYRVILECEADEAALTDDGMVIDYAVIAEKWSLVFDAIDHRTLNDVKGLDNPTTEVLAQWIYRKLKRAPLRFLRRVTVAESRTTTCTYPA